MVYSLLSLGFVGFHQQRKIYLEKILRPKVLVVEDFIRMLRLSSECDIFWFQLTSELYQSINVHCGANSD